MCVYKIERQGEGEGEGETQREREGAARGKDDGKMTHLWMEGGEEHCVSAFVRTSGKTLWAKGKVKQTVY